MKPKTKKEAYLQERFKAEENLPYEIERDVRIGKRVWKRQTQKLNRQLGKEALTQELKDS
jgi:ribosomal protein S6